MGDQEGQLECEVALPEDNLERACYFCFRLDHYQGEVASQHYLDHLRLETCGGSEDGGSSEAQQSAEEQETPSSPPAAAVAAANVVAAEGDGDREW